MLCADLKPDAPVKDESGVPTDEIIRQRYGEGAAGFLKTDVGDADQVRNLVQKAVETGGRLDV